jgi:Domain of unknown function (DUF4440)
MAVRSLTITTLFLLATFAVIAQTSPGVSTKENADDKAYLEKAEADWAESVVSNDARVLERLLAEDFVGIDIDGTRYSKASAIKDCSKPSEYVSNKLDEMTIRIYGDAAVAQGTESWKKKDGTDGKFIWTDTWIKRGGKWQAVAGEDLIPPKA